MLRHCIPIARERLDINNMSQVSDPKPQNARLLMLGALGVVFGDIGTSPLYAFREAFLGGPALETSVAHIYGVLSLIIWSLIIVITLKYLLFVMRADNEGEGGIIALVSLLAKEQRKPGWGTNILIMMGLFGAALLYGDGTITPAISVLSAVEGLEIATKAASPFVIPITVVILIGLFAFQHKGTMTIGRIFGPVMLVWFILLAILGLRGILIEPGVLQAFSPHWAIAFLLEQKWTAILVMGAVFLAVTGGEALYADMGHFGISPIRRAWIYIVFPALVLNYLGQGALVLSQSKEIYHPFFHLAPSWFLIPLVMVSTLATVIASQAVISGVFSLTRQAIQLDRLPRVRILQTNEDAYGQIYIPMVNWLLMVASIGLVLGFQSSQNLASAYGLAISIDMLITTILASLILARRAMPIVVLISALTVFLSLDLVFLSANIVKFFQGGWYPVLVALLIFTVMVLWHAGRMRVRKTLREGRQSFGRFLDEMLEIDPVKTAGTGVFVAAADGPDGAPPALVRFVQRVGAVPNTLVLFHYEIENRPFITDESRLSVRELSPSILVIEAQFGFMERIDVPKQVQSALESQDRTSTEPITYYIGRDVIVSSDRGRGWPAILRGLFSFAFVNTHRPHDRYRIPAEQVIEIGIRVPI